MKLGKLQKIKITDIWPHEAFDFTTWLAKENNLQLLSDELGIKISLEETEASVGKFNVDILAKEESTGASVVIENQFNKTDHDHLGKIITYASGLNAKYIIWISERIREEHRQAINWLNEHTDDEINFFAIKIEIWKIEDSLPAPKFQVICSPNDWVSIMKKSTSTKRELTETKIKQLEFWETYRDYCQNNKVKITPQKSYPQHWTDISMGTSLCHISLTTNTQLSYCSTEIYINDNKNLYYYLEKHKNDIEQKLKLKLDWLPRPEKKASRIIATKENFDLNNEDTWYEHIEWLVKTAELFKDVFGVYVKQFK